MNSRKLAFNVALLSALPFLPALRNGFVNWDDLDAIVRNPMLRGFSLGHLRWMLTTFHLGHWQPLAWLSLALDVTLGGGSPAVVHATAIALHAAAAAVYFLLALDLLGEDQVLPAYFAALLFAVHPLRVESVVWATERRDVLCVLFMLLSLRAYVAKRPRAALGYYALALCSKVFAAALPGVLLALDYYPLKRRDLRGKVPFILMAAAAVGVGLAAQASTPALLGVSQFNISQRLLQAGYAAAFYPAKTLFPVGLSAWYGDSLYAPLPGALAGGILLVLLPLLSRTRPALLAAWIAYLCLLLPSSGLVKSAAQLVADRYSYYACLPFPLLAAAFFGRRLAWVVPVLALLTVRQTTFWRDSVTLWTRACAMNPGSPFPRTSLILAYLDEDRPELALEQLEHLPRRSTDDGSSYEGLAARVLNNAGVKFAQEGRLEDAEAALARAVELEPGLEEAKRNLAAARAAKRSAGKRR